MAELQRLVYASYATFAPSRQAGGVEPEVARILLQSRHHNPRRGLVGALYYGDGCFFQVLEGPAEAIDGLLRTLQTDPRHRDLKVLWRGPVQASAFRDWGMKYVPAAAEVRSLLATRGFEHFDPFAFDDALLEQMLALLAGQADARAAPVAATVALHPAVDLHTWLARGLAVLAVLLAAAALLLAALR